MTIIANINSYGRFGNKFIFYLNLRSISYLLEEDWFVSDDWEGNFLFNEKGKSSNFKNQTVQMTGRDLLTIEKSNLKSIASNYNILLEAPLLGEVFFKFCNKIDIFMKENILKEKQVGMHFRGTDFKTWNPNSILPGKYYIDSIKWIQAQSSDPIKYVLYTDDMSLVSIKETAKYLEENSIKWDYGPNRGTKKFIEDFVSLSRSNYIVSSPSTFCISAGMISNAKIIHNKEWIDSRVEKNDKFWVDLNSGGNSCYKLTKKI